MATFNVHYFIVDDGRTSIYIDDENGNKLFGDVFNTPSYAFMCANEWLDDNVYNVSDEELESDDYVPFNITWNFDGVTSAEEWDAVDHENEPEVKYEGNVVYPNFG